MSLCNHWHVVEMDSVQVVSISITLVDVHLNWLNWLYFLILDGGLLVILIDCLIFYVIIPTCYKDAYVNSFFPFTAILWNSLPRKCFPLP